MSEQKEIELITITDIFNTVTKDNLDNFMIDFRNFLQNVVVLKEARLPVALEKFIWIDDGKHDQTHQFIIEEAGTDHEKEGEV
jgi:hypothetical protein